MSTRELQSTIKAMVAKKGVVETSKKIGVTTVSLQAFLHGSEVYAKTLAKMQKAAGVEVTAIPAKEKVKLAAEEKRAARKAKKAAKLAKATGKPAKKKIKAKPAKAKVKSKAPVVKKSKKKSLKARAKLAAKSLKKKKRSTKPKAAASTNGVAGPTVAAEEHEETENAEAVAEAS